MSFPCTGTLHYERWLAIVRRKVGPRCQKVANTCTPGRKTSYPQDKGTSDYTKAKHATAFQPSNSMILKKNTRSRSSLKLRARRHLPPPSLLPLVSPEDISLVQNHITAIIKSQALTSNPLSFSLSVSLLLPSLSHPPLIQPHPNYVTLHSTILSLQIFP